MENQDDLLKELVMKIRTFMQEHPGEDLRKFLRFEGYGIIEDYQEAESCLLRYKLPIETQANLIVAAYSIRLKVEMNRPHNVDGRKTALQNFKTSYAKSPKLSKVSAEQFEEFYKAVCCVKLTHGNEFSVGKNLKSAVGLITDFSPDDEAKINLIRFFVNDFNRFIGLIKSKNPDVTNTDIKNLAAIRNKIPAIKYSFPEIVSCLKSDESENTYVLENNKLFYDFTSKFGDNDGALVINPSPFFVRKWLDDRSISRQKVTFAVSEMNELSLYQSGVYPENVSWISSKKLTDFIQRYGRNHTNILYFDRKFSAESDVKLIAETYRQMYLPIKNLMIFGSDTQINDVTKVIVSENQFSQCQVQLLPPDMNYNTNPKRKMFVWFSGNDRVATETKIIQYKTVTQYQDQYLERKPFVITADRSVISSYRSFYHGAEYDTLLKTGRQRRKPQLYSFSNEITIAYKLRKNKDLFRIDAYIVNPSDGKSMVPGTEKSVRSVSEDGIINWLDSVYPYSTVETKEEIFSIRDKATELFENNNSQISLKTFLYIHSEYDVLYAEHPEWMRKALNKIGDLPPLYVTDEIINNAVEELFEGFESLKVKSFIVYSLSGVFDRAVEQKLMEENPLKKAARQISNFDRRYYEVRNSLVKRHFSLKEMTGIYKTALRNYKDDSRYLGILIKLLTGIDTSAVCALKWKDIVRVPSFPEEKFYQFVIRRKVSFNGKTYQPFSKKESYRLVPIPDLLADLLKEEQQKQLTAYNLSDASELAEQSVVGNGTVVLNGFTRVVTPSNLNELCRKVLRKYLKKNEIDLSSSDQEERIIDLNGYSGDNFKSNYRHWALEECAFEECETDYLLGNVPDMTFARNYCDFGNPASQMILKLKQERIARLVQKQTDTYVVFRQLDGSHVFCETEEDDCYLTDLSIHARIKGENAKIRISSKYGFELEVTGGKREK